MIGNKVCFFQTVESTNDYMKLNSSKYEDGNIVCSKVQTKGRGRRSNTWFSVEGNLYFTYLKNSKDQKDVSFQTIMHISTAICDTLEEYNIKATIKYPNDILVGNRKIAGILIERIIGNQDKYFVGVGLNVNSSDFSVLSAAATSIFLETNVKVDYRDVLWEIIKHYNKLDDCKHCDLYEMYKKRSVILGKRVISEGEEYLVKGINLIGELILINDGKEYKKQLDSFSFKEI